MPGEELKRIVQDVEEYERAKRRALAHLKTGFHMGAKSLHLGKNCMKERIFVDTNILIYAHDLEAGDKHGVTEDDLKWRRTKI